MLESLTIDHFKGQEGSCFTSKLENGDTLDFKLTHVSVSPSAKHIDPESDQKVPFNLTIQGPENVNMPQGMLSFTHPAFEGELPIFIVALEHDKDNPNRLIYQAVFN